MASASSETIAVTAGDESTMTPSREMEATRLRMHGILGADRGWAAPELVTEFDVNARLSFTDIKAHEYVDVPEVMAQKVELLAHMILQAEQFILYTGAGISTAAGIDDYATKAKTESVTAVDRPVVQDWKRARPTRAHRVLTALYEAGLLKHWVQQNHDSLPQKAGFPQHALNEIHGSLHDPANPIVPYEGELRPDLFQWMREWKHKADLCLALGTSMSGFNADSVPVGIAKRFLTGEGGQGTVIINLQQTRHDEMASLRIYGKLDDVLDLLIKQLQMEHLVKPTDHVYQPLIAEGTQLEEDVFRVPFNEEGLPDDTTSITWDLKVGSWVRLTGGPYAGDVGVVTSKNEDGHYSIYFEHSINHTFNIKRRPFTLWLGSWWLEMATHGRPICPGSKIPFVNCAAPVVTAEAEAAAVDLTKYLRMRKIGLAEPAIRQKMECDLIPASQIDAFFASSSSASSSS